MPKMPAQKPGRSRQDYETPGDFILAVERRFGYLAFDLAASESNAKAEGYFSEAHDSLARRWDQLGGNLWLNPPFARIENWARKCAERAQDPRWTLLLTPASIGTNWFRDHVLGKAMVFGIPRITFVGETAPYPKDLMLSAFGFGVSGMGFWDWSAHA